MSTQSPNPATPAAAAPAGATKPTFSFKDFVIKFGLLIILAVMIIVFWRLEPAFANARNMFSILQAVSVTALLALGVTVTLAIAGFDLSIGSTAAMSLMASSYVMVILNQGTFLAVVVCLLLGVFIGFLNGVLIVKGRIPDLLATLGMMFLLLGLQLIPTGGRSIAKGMTLSDGSAAAGTFTDAFLALGRHRFDFFIPNLIPVSVVVLLVLALLIWFFLEYTRFGQQVDEGIRVAHDLTQEELAQLVGASRETVNKALADFAARGWVRREGRAVVLLDVDRLERRAR